MHRYLTIPRSLLGAVAIIAAGALPLAAAPDAATRTRLSATYGALPLSFEVNEGQVDPAVRFLSRGRGYTCFLTSTEAVLSLSGPRHGTAVVRLQLAGGNRHPRAVGVNPLSARAAPGTAPQRCSI